VNPSGECLQLCPYRYYSDSDTWCKPCDNSCLVCYGGGNTKCTSCADLYFSHPNSSSTCLSICPSGYTGYNTTHACQICDPACDGCYGSTNIFCFVCIAGYFSQPNASSTCLNTCPSGYYKDWNSKKCESCADNSSLCSNNSNNSNSSNSSNGSDSSSNSSSANSANTTNNTDSTNSSTTSERVNFWTGLGIGLGTGVALGVLTPAVIVYIRRKRSLPSARVANSSASHSHRKISPNQDLSTTALSHPTPIKGIIRKGF
jgi:hypothetical protein